MNIEALRLSLKLRRQELRLTAESVADKAKSTKSNVLNFENGKANLTLATFGRICEVLGMSIELRTIDK